MCKSRSFLILFEWVNGVCCWVGSASASKDADYEGAKGSTKGLQGMMETIKGDMEAEIANGKKQDKENQAGTSWNQLLRKACCRLELGVEKHVYCSFDKNVVFQCVSTLTTGSEGVSVDIA